MSVLEEIYGLDRNIRNLSFEDGLRHGLFDEESPFIQERIYKRPKLYQFIDFGYSRLIFAEGEMPVVLRGAYHCRIKKRRLLREYSEDVIERWVRMRRFNIKTKADRDRVRTEFWGLKLRGGYMRLPGNFWQWQCPWDYNVDYINYINGVQTRINKLDREPESFPGPGGEEVAPPIKKKKKKPDEGPTHLYRHWNSGGKLLYIGISLSAFNRMIAHQRDSKWANEIASMTVESFPDRKAALAAEKKAIKTEMPLHNVTHNWG